MIKKRNLKIEKDQLPAPCNIAKDRLKRTIQSERMKVSDEVMDMMQNDIRELIERYLGASIDESDMVIEISKPQFMTPVKKKLIEPTESEL